MQTFWIIEDEPLATAHLERKIAQTRSNWRKTGQADSVVGLRQLIESAELPDVVFCDVALTDGNSFEGLADLPDNIPIIYTTAYDSYTLEAFQHMGVAYLNKPVSLKALLACLNRLFPEERPREPFKTRFLVKKGNKMIPLEVADVIYFESDTYVVAIDGLGNKHLINGTLKDLEGQLNPDDFFRVNRQQMVQRKFVRSVASYLGGRLDLTLVSGVRMVVSRERAADFKNWLEH
jgi:DNA-binding LytR/AlgR family response regulator